MGEIVVGFDGSPAATNALVWAVGEAGLRDAPQQLFVPPGGARLATWTILGRHPAVSDAESAAGVDELGLPVQLGKGIDEAVGDFEVTRHVGYGGVANRLVRASAGADLLVVGARGRGGFPGPWLGSVSRACLHAARCPVTVVRELQDVRRSHGRVVVGVDGSSRARAALRLAAEEARLRGATLHAVHAVHWDHLGEEWLEPIPEDLLTWGKRLLSKELEQEEADVAVHPVVELGHPARVLAQRSRDADLLVIGSRGHSAVANLVLGSVTNYCIEHASCPVLVVPRHGRPGIDV